MKVLLESIPFANDKLWYLGNLELRLYYFFIFDFVLCFSNDVHRFKCILILLDWYESLVGLYQVLGYGYTFCFLSACTLVLNFG